VKVNDSYELSIYESEPPTQQGLIAAMKKLKSAFPALEKEFYEILADRARENKICDSRLLASVNHVIDTCVYPTPTIANFTSYDKRVRLFTYEQYVRLINENKAAGRIYRAVFVNGQQTPMWAHVNDIEKYNLKQKTDYDIQ